MKPLPLEIPLPSIQIGDARMRSIARIFAEIITEDTAKLLDRLSDYAGIAYEESLLGGSRIRYDSDTCVDDEEAAFALAAKIRELLKGRDE